ncbi:MAG TPA: hypothetical protein VK591_00975 [Xanthobacteraceae bacterium]|nr:hypothetical protein [Xanthobacteraceae bacterium]
MKTIAFVTRQRPAFHLQRLKGKPMQKFRHLRLALGMLALTFALAELTPQPAAAGTTCQCVMPTGYTPVKGTSNGWCTSQSVICYCHGIKSSQDMCLYKIQPGGNLKSDLTPPTK